MFQYQLEKKIEIKWKIIGREITDFFLFNIEDVPLRKL